LLEFLLQEKSARLAGAQVYPKRCGDSGALLLERQQREYRGEDAFIAAAGFSE
jgi:hypothetical protein